MTLAVSRSRSEPVYVCDLDGTLLRSDATLSEFSRAGLHRLVTAGVRITIASARSAAAMRALLAGVELELPVIELNGAYVSEMHSGRHLVSRHLQQGVARRVVDALCAMDVDPVLTTWDGRADHVDYAARSNEGTAWYVAEKRAHGDPRLRFADDLTALAAREQIATIVTFAPDDEAGTIVDSLQEIAGEEAAVGSVPNLYCRGWSEIQVIHPAAEKATALCALLNVCGFGDAPVTAFGDHLNDLELFAIADRCVAPANAQQEILRIASIVVDSNDEDGVVRFLLDECRSTAC